MGWRREVEAGCGGGMVVVKVAVLVQRGSGNGTHGNLRTGVGTPWHKREVMDAGETVEPTAASLMAAGTLSAGERSAHRFDFRPSWSVSLDLEI